MNLHEVVTRPGPTHRLEGIFEEQIGVNIDLRVLGSDLDFRIYIPLPLLYSGLKDENAAKILGKLSTTKE